VSVADNLGHVRESIAAACARVGRDPTAIRILAVSKTQPATAIEEAITAGVDAIGENRVQEAAGKRPAVRGWASWHLVGPLQRNKAKAAIELFDLIETIDRTELADRLESLLVAKARQLPVFLEVNVGGEAQKSGITPAEATALATHVLERCPHLRLEGLMTVPPYHPEPERSRPYFAALRQLAATLASRCDLPPLELSMGMSDDFAMAVEEGASWVRLGRVLFGPRYVAP